MADLNQLLSEIYLELYSLYGPQGWWPLLGVRGCNPTKTGSIECYHPGDHSFPRDAGQQYEICIGAILTQNTSWTNVEKALRGLDAMGAICPGRMLSLDIGAVKAAIRPAGYYNQKARKLREFTFRYVELGGRTPSRRELLSVWGIGPETADSMLLYAFRVPSFVVDTYTRRILVNLGLIESGAAYDMVKMLFEENLTPDLQLYQEYHALLVEHAKNYYSKKGSYSGCPLHRKYCEKKG